MTTRTLIKTLRILGTRGLPAAHGGFETFAEYLALHLVQRGWRVVVYCQQEGSGPVVEDQWRGVERVHIAVPGDGPRATIAFDWKAIAHAARHRDLCLTLGYNTAVFCALLRLKGVPNLINMDGIEWSRAKWGGFAKAWFWLNDWAGCWLGNHLVADHPEIKVHLSSRVRPAKITTIAYGADRVSTAPDAGVRGLGLEPGRYMTLIARPEPENSILEVVTGYSRRPRGMLLAVLGNYNEGNAYHCAVKAAAGPEVRFLGAIYDTPLVQALRFHCAAYVHGHQVGGTNPSLVEALGAGNAVLAHDNRFNRWVAGPGATYFSGADGLAAAVEAALENPHKLAAMRTASLERFSAGLTWPHILDAYQRLLGEYVAT
jgi:glycosyltransferase involved in cell wall biosynthesis